MAGKSLQTYNKKRDFAITPEPSGRLARKKRTDLMFVIQKHDASRLHYDFRLELDGVLLSWAVPKGPSLNPKDKRLAARTEDHPLSYGDFEGTIPEKQYGAGTVMLWDTGFWQPLDKDPRAALKKGKLTFALKGEKLHGEWALVRMRPDKDKHENWLLIKHTDEEARNDETFLDKMDYSVKTGRKLDQIAKDRGPVAKKKTTKKSVKNVSLSGLEKKYKSVQLATLVDKPPQGKDWIHEVKYDGYRILCFIDHGNVKIRTRNGFDWTDRFPGIAAALREIDDTVVLDGEAVVLDENGLTDFKALQNAIDEADKEIQVYFFDILNWQGEDYAARPFDERRAALEEFFQSVRESDTLFLSETIEGSAEKIIGKACDMGLEGLISKNVTAPYVQGRAKIWLKSKCVTRQEFVICGFVPATDQPRAVGALHLGYHKKGKMLYAGKVGSGFDTKSAAALYKRLEKIKAAKHPFDSKPDGRMTGTVWVKPELLCEVKFGMWTKSGKIRHASYQGLRMDKPPAQITKEEPQPARKSIKKRKGEGAAVAGIVISHPDREIIPGSGLTKQGLAEFYAEMADYIMPSIEKRPISVIRCPNGSGDQCFFQRSKGVGMPEEIHVLDITHEGKAHDYMYVDSIAGLIGLVQMGSIEVHPWGVRIDKPDYPDRIIFDLDPAENVPFEAVRLAAYDIRKRMKKLGLECGLKVTGGKGLHVIIPIKRQHNWDVIKEFARDFAQTMVDSVPEAFTINMSKSKRNGKIFIDYLRNDFASTAVMDYCVRARPNAPVAVPISWKELETIKSPAQFTVQDVIKRKKAGKLVTDMPAPQALTKKIMDSLL